MSEAPFNEARKQLQRNRAKDLWLAAPLAEELADRLEEINRDFTAPQQLNWYGRDVRLPGSVLTRNLPGLPAKVASGEAARGSADLITSVLSLHWVNDLPGLFWAVGQLLKPDGLFLAAMLGGETLHELRAVLIEAESLGRGGAYPRVAPFVDLRDAAGLLQRAGFALPVADRTVMPVRFPNLFKLMTDLRASGETAALTTPAPPLNRETLVRAAEIYAAEFPHPDGGIRATFELLYLSGWSPDKSQPKALRPGSGQVSLADFLS